MIQKHHHLDALPDGWFYNGRHYVSMDGERSDKRPGNIVIVLCAQLARVSQGLGSDVWHPRESCKSSEFYRGEEVGFALSSP